MTAGTEHTAEGDGTIGGSLHHLDHTQTKPLMSFDGLGMQFLTSDPNRLVREAKFAQSVSDEVKLLRHHHSRSEPVPADGAS